MIVSWNELQRTCQKAFRGLGVPAGTDDDSSFAVLWLQARGLDALTPLEAALCALEHAPSRPFGLRRRSGEIDVLDADGQPAVSVASDAFDFAFALALERNSRTEILLTRVEGAIFVAGALPQRPMPGRCARAEWWDGERRRRLDVASDRKCRLCTAPANTTKRDELHPLDAVRIVIDEPAADRWMKLGSSWRIDIDETELERRATHSVTCGIEMPKPLWTRLLACAKRTLVPASETSRERGAGGGDDNN